MARRTYPLGLAEDRTGIDENYWESLPDDLSGTSASDYVSYIVEQGPFGGLLWREMNALIRSSHLTLRQEQVLRFYLLGYSDDEIATVLCVTQQTVNEHRLAAMSKCEKKKFRGLITVTIEAHGWESLRTVMSDERPPRAKNTCNEVLFGAY